jgi:hypothetical protein
MLRAVLPHNQTDRAYRMLRRHRAFRLACAFCASNVPAKTCLTSDLYSRSGLRLRPQLSQRLLKSPYQYGSCDFSQKFSPHRGHRFAVTRRASHTPTPIHRTVSGTNVEFDRVARITIHPAGKNPANHMITSVCIRRIFSSISRSRGFGGSHDGYARRADIIATVTASAKVPGLSVPKRLLR